MKSSKTHYFTMTIRLLWGLPSPMTSKSGRLSDLCMQLLGKPLNKAEQTSDWSKRPLTASKMEYAALDAWVCVELYKVKQNKEKSS